MSEGQEAPVASAALRLAYEQYDGDPRVSGPEDYEAFADAVGPVAVENAAFREAAGLMLEGLLRDERFDRAAFAAESPENAAALDCLDAILEGGAGE